VYTETTTDRLDFYVAAIHGLKHTY